MTRHRQRIASGVLAVLATAVLGAAGCGVPTSSGVQRVGPGPAEADESPGEGVAPPGPDLASTHREQVSNFLQAAAGDPATAADRVREYIHSSQRARWEPEENVRVVRLLDEPFIADDSDGGWLVELRVLPIGELHREGYLDTEAPAVAQPVTYKFRVEIEGDGENLREPSIRLRIADPPAQVLLADTALADRDYFYPNPIYFWDPDRTELVPDLRWLPLAGEPVDQQAWRVVQWLVEGPAPSLPRAEGLPAGSQHIGTPVWEGERLIVNFNPATIETQRDVPVQAEVDDLATQLEWSLLQLRPGAELELLIGDQPQDTQPHARPRQEPVRFAVLDGVVRPLAGAEATPPAVLTGGVNTGVQRAALSLDGDLAALVRQRADGQQELRVARARADADPAERSTGLVAASLGRPVWVSADDPDTATGLVVADGELYQFTAGGERAEIPVPAVNGPITGLALAPERRRLAFVAGDRLYVASLRPEGGAVTVQTPRALPTTIATLTAVAFSRETHLVVAGEKDGRTWLYELTVDGGVENQLQDLGNLSVSALVAYPGEDPADEGTAMYEANGQSYTYTFTGAPRLIRADELVDAPDDAESPPRAPFFLG